MNKLVYLMIPYAWNPDASFDIACEVAADLMNKGLVVFSPVSHSHPIADYLDPELRLSQEFWMKQDLTILEKCDEAYLVVIGKYGDDLINNSKGCQSEIEKVNELGLNITRYHYNE